MITSRMYIPIKLWKIKTTKFIPGSVWFELESNFSNNVYSSIDGYCVQKEYILFVSVTS